MVEVLRRTVTVESVQASSAQRHRLAADWFGIGAELGESPFWVGGRGVMASVDVTGQSLHLLRLGAGVDEVVPLPGRTNAAMPGEGSTIVLAANRSLREYLIDDKALRPMGHRPGGPPAGKRFSDGKVDGAGRIWIGARRPDGAAGSGSLLSWEAGQPPVVRIRGLTGPNGLAWNVAGDQLYLADSRRRLIHRYRFDQEAGSVSDDVMFAQWSEREGRPDGITVDADDHVWCAAWDAGCIRRYDPLGRVVQTLFLPAIRPTSCAFGGTRLDQLWVTTARAPNADPADLGGGLFAIDVGRTGFAPAAARAT